MFTDGIAIPAGTTSAVTSALDTYLFDPLTSTLFQVQMIQILIVCASVYIMWKTLLLIWSKFHSPVSNGLSVDREIAWNNHASRMLKDRSYWEQQTGFRQIRRDKMLGFRS